MTKELIDISRKIQAQYHFGWGAPEYTNWMDEQMSWKETCYVGDWSFILSLVIDGPDFLKLFSDISVNSFAKFDIGQAKHAIQCNEDGKVVTEGILERLGEQQCSIHASPATYVAYKAISGNYNVKVQYVNWHFYQIQGPNALYVVEKLTGQNMRDIGFMRFRMANIRGHRVLALRQGMAGELGGFEIQCFDDKSAKEVYDAILEDGKEFGIRRLGKRSGMINHVEACFPTTGHHYLPAMFGKDMEGFMKYVQSKVPFEQGLPVEKTAYLRGWGAPHHLSGSFEGNDISDYYRSPVELGWISNIKFDHNFIGRKALESEVAHPKRTVVTLEFNSDDMVDVYASLFRQGEPYEFLDIPHHQKRFTHADQVLKDGKLIGISTCPIYSYYFRKILALSYVDVELTKPGTEVIVVWGNPGKPQKHVRAMVAPAPYKKDDRRGDLNKIPQLLK